MDWVGAGCFRSYRDQRGTTLGHRDYIQVIFEIIDKKLNHSSCQILPDSSSFYWARFIHTSYLIHDFTPSYYFHRGCLQLIGCLYWKDIPRVKYTIDFDPKTSISKTSRTTGFWKNRGGSTTKPKCGKGTEEEMEEIPYTCLACRQDYELQSGEKRGSEVIILPDCHHHFHSSCLKDPFQIDKSDPNRPRFKSIEFIVFNCPICKLPYPVYPSAPWHVRCWENFTNFLDRFIHRIFKGNKYSKAYKPQKSRPLEVDKLL
ncbi:hypothetical protein MJO28_015806 [Puccinia striiformis f. sp. tritici]|uniref:RING-type domain-containing protein n=3 Tax=Puccinia striiformis TaxID=27350 RepID=A0A0L0V4U5_9BASI|nr:hypothetical protein MJO28_015806 [Puccinia striiformis f. sp. tritici]KNE94303.1 hypothetical protein PSTG_12327 [Puccinia striiformis f. sp. tritici PST-78]POW09563.1 hypothetical protein PSTT_06753 [Puccinia striiformis]